MWSQMIELVFYMLIFCIPLAVNYFGTKTSYCPNKTHDRGCGLRKFTVLILRLFPRQKAFYYPAQRLFRYKLKPALQMEFSTFFNLYFSLAADPDGLFSSVKFRAIWLSEVVVSLVRTNLIPHDIAASERFTTAMSIQKFSIPSILSKFFHHRNVLRF